MPRKILVVDDDSHIREVLRYALEKEKFQVLEAEDGLQGLAAIKQAQPDVIILDIMMPEMNGLDLCRELRKTLQTPILFLSSRDDEIDRILGLELGGDDYLTKPFSPRELIARVKVMVRRLDYLPHPQPESAVLRHGEITVDPTGYQVLCKGTVLTLTTTEFNLLETFFQYPEKVYTRDALIQADIFKDIISDRTIDSHIRRLRHKFSAAGYPNVIETVHGFGYKLGSCQTC
jgi:two-component system OmpR family response regulator